MFSFWKVFALLTVVLSGLNEAEPGEEPGAAGILRRMSCPLVCLDQLKVINTTHQVNIPWSVTPESLPHIEF